MAPKLYLIEGACCDIVKVYESSSLIGCLYRKIGYTQHSIIGKRISVS